MKTELIVISCNKECTCYFYGCEKAEVGEEEKIDIINYIMKGCKVQTIQRNQLNFDCNKTKPN